MKVLFFHAAAGHPKVAPPQMHQTWETLRPFHRFLGQAIHTARQRQVRYQLPWARVRDLRSIRLEPVDSLLRVPRRTAGMILTGWPADKQPDFAQQGFVIDRGVAVRIEAATRTDQGLLVRTDPPLRASDRFLWCGLTCELVQEAAPAPPRAVTDRHGAPLQLVARPRAHGDRHWLLCVAGTHGDCDLVVDGEEVEAEALPVMDGLRRVVDDHGRSFEIGGGLLRVEEPPADGLLRGDDGVRYRWTDAGAAGRRGNWIQLLLPETTETDELDDILDPRAAFCEGEVREVWTQPRGSRDTTFQVKRVDQDRYQLLLDRLPPEGTTIYLPVDLRNLWLQKRALRQLAESPLPHHQGLLRLCEDPARARWPQVQPVSIASDGWCSLTDESRSGTTEQRAFVSKALGSPELAILEGPPGSGKTTAICELVQQLVARGQRVLLCASTHVAIDNVLERLLGSDSPIDAVRIGKLDRVDDAVQAAQLDARVQALVSAWRGLPAMRGLGDDDLAEMATRTIIMAANLTCGTTMGIVNHPLFRGRGEDMRASERPITTMPHWDVLVVDEASKTLVHELMVPALMARRWVIVGDVRQLPPFADRASLVANLRDLMDERDRPLFPPDHQRARLLLFRLLRRHLRGQPGMRWLLVERPGVLAWLARELEAEPMDDLSVVRVGAGKPAADGVGGVGGADGAGGMVGAVTVVTAEQLRSGAPEALRLAAADWVLVSDDLLPGVADLLPPNLLLARDLSRGPGAVLAEGDALLARQAWWLARARALPRPYRDRQRGRDEVSTMADSQACEADWLTRHDLAQELAWRLTRLHELRHSRDDRERKRLRDDLARLQPRAAHIADPLSEIQDIGLPSILEVLQEGIGEHRSKRRSALTLGLRASRPDDFDARFESLGFQHRMHPDIASFSREVIYQGQALRDANTIRLRDERLGWDFGSDSGWSCARRAWADVAGREQSGENQDEVRVIAGILRDFIAWARRKGPPRRHTPKVWEVACLCFYVKQERALSEMLRALTQDDRKTRFQVRDAPVEVVCATVDRFQGREADLVLLSMRNTWRFGFLDSPNRLNVAVTRARQQLVIVGKAGYFGSCGVAELEELVRRTRRVEQRDVRRWRRDTR